MKRVLAGVNWAHARDQLLNVCVYKQVCVQVCLQVCVCVRSIYLFGQSDLRATRIKIEFTSYSVYTA